MRVAPGARFVAALCAAVLIGTACSSGGRSSGRDAHRSPQAVALAWTEAGVQLKFLASADLVVPQQRFVAKNLQTGADSGGEPGYTKNLKVGAVTRRGDDATVVIVGSVCSPAGRCITNTDPHSANPEFLVHTVHTKAGWYVTFPIPADARINSG